MSNGRPFALPEDVGLKRKRPRDYLYRAASAHIRAHLKGDSVERHAKEMFGDPVTDLVIRAASSAATTTSPSWASALAQQVVDDSIMAIATLSAAAGLISRGMKIDFARRASIRVPGRILDATDAGQWVGEGKPIVVRTQRMTSGPTLTPHKLCVITSYSREMAEASAIEAVSRALIQEASALALDKALFGTQADDGITPGGILNGVAPITATAGGGINALNGDIKALMAALSAAYAGAAPVLIMNPVQATSLRTVASPLFAIPILESTALAAGTVIMVEPSSFVSAFDATPEFDVVTAPLFHYEDTSPQDITGGTPSPAVPVRSLFQTDSIGLRMILKAAWGMRAPHIAVVNGATW
jgi:HK97 family phage major capsid protein